MRPVSHFAGLILALLLSTTSIAEIIQEPVPPSPKLHWDLYSALQAEYQHDGFRTLISDISDFVLGEDSGNGKGLIVLGGGRGSGIISWQSDNATDPSGPQTIILASPITDQQLNAWLADPIGSQVDPTLFIPVTEMQPPQGIILPDSAKYWSNESDVIARIFVRNCFDDVYRTFGDISIGKNSVTFVTWADEQGDSNVEFFGAGSQLKVIQETWSAIVSSCGLQNLPVDAMPGTATNFSGSSVQPPYPPDTLPGQFGHLIDRMRALLYTQTLSDDQARPLLNDLNTASILSLRNGQSDEALTAMAGFNTSVQELASLGIVDVGESKLLIAAANEIRNGISELAAETPPVPNVIDFCPGPAGACETKEPCTRTVLHVSRGGKSASKPDGSPAHPYRSIRQALRRAEAGMLCGVDLIVDQGTYRGNITITRDTHIAARYPDDPLRPTIIQGTIENHGPFELGLDDVTISYPHRDGIVSDHACATTILNDVQIIGARGYGIHHLGGILRATKTDVSGTRVSRPLSTGTGILMSCGAQGQLAGLRITENQSAGLVLAGTGTRVSVLDLMVTGTGTHPRFSNRIGSTWGGVHVQDEAQLTGYGYSITDNEVFGLRVESDAEVNLSGSTYTIERLEEGFEVCGTDFRWEGDPPDSEDRCTAGITRPSENMRTVTEMGIANALIARTQAVMDGFGAVSGGANVLVGGGLLRLTNFHLDGSNFGITLARRGEADLDTGIVSNHSVGAIVIIPGYDLSRLENGVTYRDNETGLQASSLPIPEAEGSLPIASPP